MGMFRSAFVTQLDFFSSKSSALILYSHKLWSPCALKKKQKLICVICYMSWSLYFLQFLKTSVLFALCIRQWYHFHLFCGNSGYSGRTAVVLWDGIISVFQGDRHVPQLWYKWYLPYFTCKLRWSPHQFFACGNPIYRLMPKSHLTFSSCFLVFFFHCCFNNPQALCWNLERTLLRTQRRIIWGEISSEFYFLIEPPVKAFEVHLKTGRKNVDRHLS